MKKLLFLFMFLPLLTMAKGVSIKISTENGIVPEYSDSIISVNFYESYGSPYFIKVELTNLTKDRIEIEWENAKLESGRMYFNDDTVMLMDNTKRENEVVFGGDKTHKEFTSKTYYPHENLRKIYTKKDVKENNGTLKRNVIIPIIYNGKTIDYRFTLVFFIE